MELVAKGIVGTVKGDKSCRNQSGTAKTRAGIGFPGQIAAHPPSR
jgi:hypothetical protein